MKNLNLETIIKWSEKCVKELANGSNACYFFPLGASNCKTNSMFIVIGWQGGFGDTNSGIMDGDYRVCTKLAYNDSALQCDYDVDWVMPFDEESGDVDDTECIYGGRSDIEYLFHHWEKFYKCA